MTWSLAAECGSDVVFEALSDLHAAAVEQDPAAAEQIDDCIRAATMLARRGLGRGNPGPYPVSVSLSGSSEDPRQLNVSVEDVLPPAPEPVAAS